MSGRKGKSQTNLNRLANKNTKCVEWMPRKKQELKEEPQHLVARKKSYRPHTLSPSIIRRICHMPPEKYNARARAKVMYINWRFGKCRPAVCHEDLCPYTEVCKLHKRIPKISSAIMKNIRRLVKKSARNSPIYKGKINT